MLLQKRIFGNCIKAQPRLLIDNRLYNTERYKLISLEKNKLLLSIAT